MKRSKTDPMYGWHTVKRSGCTRYGKCRPQPGGKEWFRRSPQICYRGLHFATNTEQVIRNYLYGPILRRVICYGEIVQDGKKFAAQHRDELWRVNVLTEVRNLYIKIHGKRLERLLNTMRKQKSYAPWLKNINNMHELCLSSKQNLIGITSSLSRCQVANVTDRGYLYTLLHLTLAALENRCLDGSYIHRIMSDCIFPYITNSFGLNPRMEQFLLSLDPRKKDGDKSEWKIRVLK